MNTKRSPVNSNAPRAARTLSVFLAACVIIRAVSHAHAERSAGDGAPAVHKMDEFVVLERLGRDAVHEPWLPAPSQALSLSIISREELELLRPRTVIEALEFEPGVQVKRQGRKNTALLSVRGEGTVLTLMDGQYVGTWRDYRFLQSLPPSLVEEIVVIRDSSSLIYGPPQFAAQAGAGTVGYGGVFDVHLRRPTDTLQGEVRAEFGSYQGNVQHLHLSGPLVRDRLHFVVSANRDHFGGPGGENMGSEFTDFLGRTVWRYDGDSTLTLTVHHEEGSRELQRSEPYSRTYGWVEEYDPWISTTTMLALNHIWDNDSSTMVNAYYRHAEATLRYHHGDGRKFDMEESKRGVDVRQTLRWWDRYTLRLGVQAAKWVNPTGKLDYGGWFQRPNLTWFRRSIAHEETEYGTYIQNELIVLPERLTLDGGLRWDRKHVAKGHAVRNGAVVSRRSYWGDPALSYSFGARLELTGRQTLTTRYSVSNVDLPSTYTTGTGAPLDDCTETRYELGYEYRFHPALVVTVTGFWKEIDNGIVYDGQYTLAGEWLTAWEPADFRRYGYELEMRGELLKGLTYFTSCTYVRSINRDTNRSDKRLPRYLLSGGLRYQGGAWKAAAAIQHTTRYQDDFQTAPPRFIDVGNYTLVDVNVARMFQAERLEHELYGGVRNLLNERYENVPGWKDPGILLYAGYALRF